ncbi:MAG: class 1 fructose-bisphosphatase [Ignavibacteriales bacterium]|nr:class 1 fructose-bisphosphatase [Ignavibacteriales bacterium]
MAKRNFVTIERHIIEEQMKHPEATGELSKLLTDLSIAAKIISREVNKAGLVNILGVAGGENVHGERVKKLDVFAHDLLFGMMDHGGQLAVMASEEEEGVMEIPPDKRVGKYVLLFDPLDGSSNIDANVSIGTIFSIFRRVTEGGGPGGLEDCVRPGVKQVAAGYVLYGSSTMFVYTAGEGTHGFTLDPSIGEFLLSHENIRIPKRGNIYSVNEGNYPYWSDGLKRYVENLRSEQSPIGKPYSARYIGSMVADVHRTLLYGGVFLYPADAKRPNGKLRLLYEANPMAFIVESAGGKASDGAGRILERTPEGLHDRCPVILGSADDVADAERFLREERG